MRKSRLSKYKQDKLLEPFVAGSTARVATSLVGVNKNTASYYFHRLRLLIYECSEEVSFLEGEVEADESYFGGKRKGKRDLRKFNGIPREHFHLFLKKCEWRFNHCDPREKLS